MIVCMYSSVFCEVNFSFFFQPSVNIILTKILHFQNQVILLPSTSIIYVLTVSALAMLV